ncbi:amino acid ABC transporter substrate-binding protein [Pigmentiphaga sp. GD03639]|uniref:amino acid ABC transporter substrate-binding protein n=1 Tax=unclassified Pigmentiphaga TaxID=2626614 RepID=UPI0024478075|nr:amino acid ABC transporter substrate-binding protein [Pigmentiphaga sp. GD03639]MDH2234904.1 amino acid ABC transporter substrate-binding protein [Pigmentiphaga sp. GD03639]
MLTSSLKSLRRLGTAVALSAFSLALPAHAQDAVTIGYAVSKTGVNAGGAGITTIPNYKLWVHEVNQAGGLKVGAKRLPIKVVEYDDRSSSEDAVRAVERLITQDKVDFLLPPWSTAMNLAVAPTFHRYGYPLLAGSAVTERAPEFAKRWPNSYWLLGTGSQYAEALVDQLTSLRKAGKIGDSIAMVSIADGFGIELATAARAAFQKAGFKLAYAKTYPVGTQDLAPIVTEARNLNPDVFIAFSYPPDTMAITDQARVLGFNPKVFYTGVGTAFPLYKNRFGANVEGVASLGGIDANSPAVKAYIQRHKEVTGAEPDRWASLVTYAGLQVLQQAIEKAGTLDRKAVSAKIASEEFDTILGRINLKNHMVPNMLTLGQWQNGEFVGIEPASHAGAAKLVFPKSAWQAGAAAR